MRRYHLTESGKITECPEDEEKNEEQAEAKKEKDSSKGGSYVGCFVLSICGAVLGDYLLESWGLREIDQWVKYAAVLLVALPLGAIGYRYGRLIFGLILLTIFVGIAAAVGRYMWIAL